MSVFVPYLMQIICIFLTFLSTFFPSIDHSCQYCDTCQHTGGTATCISRAVCDECGEEYGAPLGHSMNLIAAKAATCIAEGNNKYYYCKNCDTFFADAAGKQETSVENMTIAINPDAHVWNGGSVTTEASCCVMGVKTYVCTLNSVHTKTEEIGYNANNHINTKEIAAVDATCDTIGYTAGVFCVDCDAYISGHVEVPALGHDMKETAAAVAPTCTEAGKTAVLTCANNCGKTEGGEEVAALGHTEETIPAVDATCEATGLTAGVKCAVCGEILTAQEAVPVLGHTPAEAVEENRVESTCTVAGSYESVVYCSVCGEELSRETVALELADHTEGAVVVENEVAATCTAEGSYDNVVYCTACNAELSRETITVDKIAHDYEAVVTAPTCTEDGYTTYICSACGDSYVADEVDALGHTESEAVEENRTESTCTVAGSYDSVVYCSVCGEELSRETVALELASHTAGEVVVENEVAATCTADGSYDNVVYCTVCNAELSRNTVTVDKIAHDYEAVVTAPTCTEDGYTTYTCSACGDSYVADEVDALGHDMKETAAAVAPKCEEAGMSAVLTCANGCGKTEGGEAIPETGHDYDDGVYADGVMTYTCKNDPSHTYVEEVKTLTADDFTVRTAEIYLTFTVYDPETEDALITCNKADAVVTYLYGETADTAVATPASFGIYNVYAEVSAENGYVEDIIDLSTKLVGGKVLYLCDTETVTTALIAPTASNVAYQKSILIAFSDLNEPFKLPAKFMIVQPLPNMHDDKDFRHYLNEVTKSENEVMAFVDSTGVIGLTFRYTNAAGYVNQFKLTNANGVEFEYSYDIASNTMHINVLGAGETKLSEALRGTGLKTQLLNTEYFNACHIEERDDDEFVLSEYIGGDEAYMIDELLFYMGVSLTENSTLEECADLNAKLAPIIYTNVTEWGPGTEFKYSAIKVQLQFVVTD